MDDTKEMQKQLESLAHEVKLWRENFIEAKLTTSQFRFLDEQDKYFIRMSFRHLPSHEMLPPQQEWERCLAVLIQRKKQP